MSHCAFCKKEFSETDTGVRYVGGYGYVCEECIEKNFNVCECCGYIMAKDRSFTFNGHTLCEECFDANQNPNYDGILGYHDHHNLLPIFFGSDKENTIPYLGVELEVDNGGESDDVADDVREFFDDTFVYSENDGSLDDGFEIITQPATLEYHYGEKEYYSKAFQYLTGIGYRSHKTSTCGLHVHFNRSFFSDNEELYITRLLYIVEKFWDELTKFSRRSLRTLSRWAKKYEKTPTEVVEDMKHGNLDRYQAINLKNQNTIEFRMFRGTLKLNTFIATLQLVNNIIIICRNVKSNEDLQKIEWKDLLTTEELLKYWEEVKDRVIK